MSKNSNRAFFPAARTSEKIPFVLRSVRPQGGRARSKTAGKLRVNFAKFMRSFPHVPLCRKKAKGLFRQAKKLFRFDAPLRPLRFIRAYTCLKGRESHGASNGIETPVAGAPGAPGAETAKGGGGAAVRSDRMRRCRHRSHSAQTLRGRRGRRRGR